MRRPIVIAMGALLLARLAVCEAQPQASRFEWAMGTFAGQQDVRVAMLVPVLIEGRPCHMQLDTGLPRAVAWHEYSGDNDATQAIKVSFAGHETLVEASRSVRDMVSKCQPGEPVGSLGNAFFEHGTLSIDLKGQRISHQAGSTLQASDPGAHPFTYAKSDTGGAHIVTDVCLGDEKGLALLDTGSTALELSAFETEGWKRLTNDTPLHASDRVAVFDVHAWGAQHPCFMARSAVPWRIASKAPSHPTVTHCPTIRMESKPELLGVVGMKPFMDDTLVIDYPARLWSTSKSTSAAD